MEYIHCTDTECDGKMLVEEVVVDYNDPGDVFGHGQYTYTCWVCEKCKEQISFAESDAEVLED